MENICFLQEQDVTTESIEADILSSHNLGNLCHIYIFKTDHSSHFVDTPQMLTMFIENI